MSYLWNWTWSTWGFASSALQDSVFSLSISPCRWSVFCKSNRRKQVYLIQSYKECVSFSVMKWKCNVSVFYHLCSYRRLFCLSLNVLQALAMGGSKSKPKDESKRTRSLDVNLSSGGGAANHHLNSNQQSLTPNRSPTIDTGLSGNTSLGNMTELALFGGVDINNVSSSNIVTLAGEYLSLVAIFTFILYMHCLGRFNCVPCMYCILL